MHIVPYIEQQKNHSPLTENDCQKKLFPELLSNGNMGVENIFPSWDNFPLTEKVYSN